jgi:predicted nucleic acid-binding protein
LLFDTTALIDIYRANSAIDRYLGLVKAGQVLPFVSMITEAELGRWLRPDELDRHQDLLQEFGSLAVDSRVARLAGIWMQRYKAQGLGWMDALIVSTARVSEMPVLTRDCRLAAVLAAKADFVRYEPA